MVGRNILVEEKTPETVREKVDIEREASDLATYSPGSLEEIEQVSRIKAHWFRERAILLLSICVILGVLGASLSTLIWSQDASSRDWARQMVAALMGFAASAVWQSQRKSD
jgi:hypothetical protein